MPYPGQFHRLVLIGGIYGETWNTSLSIVPSALGELGMPAVDEATLNAVSDDVKNWWNEVPPRIGPNMLAFVNLRSIKLNRIGPDGKYVDPVSREFVYSAPISGNTSQFRPSQISAAVTLRTAIPRGRGSHGRMYLPPSAATLSIGGDGRLGAVNAESLAVTVADLFRALNTRYSLIGRVGVASDAGAGRFEHCTRVEAGRVLDTIRSRRTSLVEDYQGVDI